MREAVGRRGIGRRGWPLAAARQRTARDLFALDGRLVKVVLQVRRQAALAQIARLHRHEMSQSGAVVEAARARPAGRVVQTGGAVRQGCHGRRRAAVQPVMEGQSLMGRQIHRSAAGIGARHGRRRGGMRIGRRHHLGHVLQGCRFYRT